MTSESILQSLFNAMTDIVFEMDYDGKYINIAPTSPELMFKPSEDTVGKSLHETFPKPEADRFLKFVRKCLDDNAVVNIEYPLVINNKTIWFEGRATPKTKNTILYIARNITDRKLAEEQIKDSLQQIEIINANTPNIIWKSGIDNNGKFINSYISEVVDEFLALPKGTINSSWDKYFEYVAPQYMPEIREKMGKAFAKPGVIISFDYEVKKATGEIAWFSSKGRVHSDNNKLVAFGSTVDISERKKAEKALKEQNEEYASLNEEFSAQNEELYKAKAVIGESEKKFKTIFENSPLGVFYYNSKGIIIDCNNNFIDIVGSTKEVLVGMDMINRLQDKKLVAAIKESLLSGKSLYNDYYKSITVKKTTPVRIILKGIKDKKGKIISGIGIVEDITTQKQAENEIRAANEELTATTDALKGSNSELIVALKKAEESDRLKTEFLHNMSHEIRTPMNGILGFSKMINDPSLSIKKREYYANIIINSGNRLMRIIDDILEISQLGTKQVTILNEAHCLNDLLLELFSIFDVRAKENKTPLYLKKELSDAASMIYTDRVILNKILKNLLENALKFTNKGFIELGYILVKTRLGVSLQIYVKDTGIGIARNKQGVIFERFSQEEKELSQKVGGLGLGLSIAKENTELLGGEITLKSEKGKGATFFVTIPYKPANFEAEIKSTENNSINKSNYSVLIVEDEEINYLYVETLLETFQDGIKTLHAKNGEEAIETCKNNSDIDLILMDLKLPIMNGYEATKQIKKLRPDLPIIAQTAYTAQGDMGRAILAGCDDFISKPIAAEDFNEMMRQYLTL